MFKELLPLLRQRAVLMTVCVVEAGSLRVNIMPKKTGTEDAAKGGADSNTALTTPLSVTGTAEELDRDLPQAIVEFVASHLTLKQSLEATQAEMCRQIQSSYLERPRCLPYRGLTSKSSMSDAHRYGH